MAREQARGGRARSRCWPRWGPPRRACARSSASRWRRSRSSTCRCRARPRRRSTRCMPTRWRSTTGREVPRLEAIPHLQARDRARSDLRDGARAAVGGLRQHRAVRARARASSRKAFELRDRVSERERFFISWRYYRDAIQAWDKALDAGALLDGHLSARSVRLQQPGQRPDPLRPVRASRCRRCAKRSGSIHSSSRPTPIWRPRCSRSTACRRRERFSSRRPSGSSSSAARGACPS